MKCLLLVLVAAAALAPAALAKGPSEAAITGPGLGKTISFTGNGEREGTALGYLTEYTGFFPSVFGQSPDPMLRAKPAGELGPVYTIHYVVPGPDQSYRLDQELYPYAHGGAVTHMEAGQRIFDTDRSIGGWYRTDPALKRLLVRHGLPRTAPIVSSNSTLNAGSTGGNMAILLGFGVSTALLIAGAAALVARRRVVGAR